MYNVQNFPQLNIITDILTKQSYIELDIEREREISNTVIFISAFCIINRDI